HGRRDPGDLRLLAAGATDAGGPVRRRPERRLGAVDHGEHVQPGADVLHRAVRPADPVLLLLLHLHHVQPGGSRRQHEALRWLHPGDPCGASHGRVPAVRDLPDHLGRVHLPGDRGDDPDDCVQVDGRVHEHPVRRRLPADPGQRGTGHGQADRFPVAATALRRVLAMSTRLILLGAPGAGKGTPAARLASALGLPAISTADIFRANVSEGTDLGRLAQKYMHARQYVPDEVTNQMVAARLAEPDAAEGFLLDGYPRTKAQVEELDAMLQGGGHALSHVVELTADTEEVVQRLLGRAREQGRADDTESVIRRRLEVYAEQTAPLVRLYEERGLLVRVDGMGEVDEVTDRLLNALGVSGT